MATVDTRYLPKELADRIGNVYTLLKQKGNLGKFYKVLNREGWEQYEPYMAGNGYLYFQYPGDKSKPAMVLRDNVRFWFYTDLTFEFNDVNELYKVAKADRSEWEPTIPVDMKTVNAINNIEMEHTWVVGKQTWMFLRLTGTFEYYATWFEGEELATIAVAIRGGYNNSVFPNFFRKVANDEMNIHIEGVKDTRTRAYAKCMDPIKWGMAVVSGEIKHRPVNEIFSLYLEQMKDNLKFQDFYLNEVKKISGKKEIARIVINH